MAKIQVPRAEVARLLGLSPDVDDDTLHREMQSRLARIDAESSAAAVSAAEQRARAEDRQIVIAAYNAGKFPAERIEFWCSALQKNRERNRALIASLASGLPPAEKVAADADLKRVHAGVMARLGIVPTLKAAESGRTVAASQEPSGLRSTGPAASGPVDMLGQPIPGVPAPVRISRGKPPEEWTWKERADWFCHQLGPRFRRGTEPPPKGDTWYQPSPNDPYEFDEASGEFRPKGNNDAPRVWD